MKKSTITIGIHSKELEAIKAKSLNKIRETGLEDVGIAAKQSNFDPQIIVDELEAGKHEVVANTTKWFQQRTGEIRVEIESNNVDRIHVDVDPKRELIAKKTKAVEVDIDRHKKSSYPHHLIWIPMVGIVTLMSSDVMVNYKTLQLLTPNLLTAIVVSIIFIGSLSLAAHAIGGNIREAQTTAKKRMWWGVALLTSCIVFFLLGLMRYSYYGNSGGWVHHPLIWMAWNSVFYLTAVYVSAAFMPSKEQRKQHQQLLVYKKTRKDLLVEDEALRKLLEEAQAKADRAKEELSALEVYEEETRNHIEKECELILRQLHKEYQFKGGTGAFDVPEPVQSVGKQNGVRKVLNSIIILIIFCFATGCNNEVSNQARSFLVDCTDTHFVHLDASSLQQHSLLFENELHGDQIRIQALTEFDFNEIHEHNIDAVGNKLFGNEVDRKDEIKEHQDAISTSLSSVASKMSDRQGSLIFPVIVQELKWLQRQSDVEHRSLVISSDLMEKSHVADFYSNAKLQQIRNDPERVINQLLGNVVLGDLSGIKVSLLYQSPRSVMESERWRLISGLYETMLISAGAEVEIGVNLLANR